jgi:hypothetical protein
VRRKWEKGESFSDYIHQKIILGNRVPIAEEELVGYIIDVPDRVIRNEARISGATREALRAIRASTAMGKKRRSEKRRRKISVAIEQQKW